jgi:hypothetical protein
MDAILAPARPASHGPSQETVPSWRFLVAFVRDRPIPTVSDQRVPRSHLAAREHVPMSQAFQPFQG